MCQSYEILPFFLSDINFCKNDLNNYLVLFSNKNGLC